MATRKTSKSASAGQSDQTLERYRSMRDFQVTSEPRGAQPNRQSANGTTSLPFVVQKHAASRLHYDFRLGWRGLLKSWAVAKGPSYFPGDKRLAVQVEDHPMEYGDFEGTIPKGQYGGGTVMIWDTGTWDPHDDVDQGLKEGHLKFELRGKKLKGSWALVRMHGRASNPEKPNWLLIKERDSHARESSDIPITEQSPDSAVTGRTIDEIAKNTDRVRRSSRSNGNGPKNTTSRSHPENGSTPVKSRLHPAKLDRALSAAKRERFPGFISPQLAQPSSRPPIGKDWVHELKLDGYRIQIHLRTAEKKGANQRQAQLLTRKGLDWTARMPDIAEAAAKLKVTTAIIDGEAVALDNRGVSNFADLQAAFQEGKQSYITYFAFDVLHLDGHNLRDFPLLERKRILEQFMRSAGHGTPLRFSESFEAEGKDVLAKACALGAEGIVSKLGSAKYSSGRNNSWLKVKCHLEQEFVIGGFTLPSKGTVGIGALLLGYYSGRQLQYAGRCGTGYSQKTHRSLRARLDRVVQKKTAFANVPLEARKEAIWVKPELVAEISFATWTRDNLVRQASFKGLREDKPAAEVTRETPVAFEARAKSGRRGLESRAHSRGTRIHA